MNYIRGLFKNIPKPIYVLPVVFALISLTMMLSTSYDDGIVFSRTFVVQAVAYILGFVLVFVIMRLNYSVLEEMQKPLYIFSVLFLLTPYLPIIGVSKYGARSWINIGFTTFQPSEIIKITFIVLLAIYFNKHRNSITTLKDFGKAVLYAAPIILIVLKEDFGSAAVFIVIFIAMLLSSGVNMKLFGKIAIAVVIAIPFLFKLLDTYQQQRITAFLYPNDLSIQANYQVWQSKIAIGSGGIFGKGLFNGTQKDLDFLPVRNSDFIFSVICEELGFVGGTILICLFIWLLISILKLSFNVHDKFGSLMLIGFLGLFAAQIFENIAMTMGLMPVTGITLPFISYGGSSILSNMLCIALILNIAVSNRGVAFIK